MLSQVDREEASKALELLRSVVRQARDDTVLQNWGRIWILHAFTNGAAFCLTHLLLARGVQSRSVFAALWLVTLTINIASIFALKTRSAGTRSFVENQIWAIWLTFIFAVILLAIVNHLLGLPLARLAPVIGILSAVGFSSMGAVMGRRWFLAVAVFVAATLAMALFPGWQFLILGGIWWATQLAGGLWLESEKRRRTAADQHPVRLV